MSEFMVDERLEVNAENVEEKVEPSVEVTYEAQPVQVVKYSTPQPNIPRGTRIRNPKIAKNMRNQPCGCNSGRKFKKCCGPNVTSEEMYIVPSAAKENKPSGFGTI